MTTRSDEHWMAAALDEAALGVGAVEPNPPVGAVLVRDGIEIARGHHTRFGAPHAEPEALAQAARRGVDVAGATMYVTLEPCSHHGKTPPCVEAIIEARLGRVVAAMVDPDARVSGRGLDALRQAGIAVDVGVCEPEARELLGAYVTLRTRRRPWVIAKWAQTPQGHLALPPRLGRWISSPASRDEVHRLRAICDGILIGSGTLLDDDPELTNRSGQGRRPVRVVLDARLRTPPGCRLLATADRAPVLIVTGDEAIRDRPGRADALRRAGAELLVLPCPAGGGVDVAALLAELGGRDWTRLLVEGGAGVLKSFFASGQVDEAIVYVSSDAVADAPVGWSAARWDVAELIASGSLAGATEGRCGPDRRITWRRSV